MHPAGGFTRGEETGHGRGGGVGVHADAPHDVMRGGPDFHRALRDVDVREFHELVVHRGKFLLHHLGRLVRDVEEGAPMRAPAPFLDLGVDRARDHVAGRKLHPLRIVPLHEALAARVPEQAPLAAHRLGDQEALHAGRPDHPGRMELHEFHVDQLGARFERQGVAVRGVFPGIRRDLVGLADSARGDHDRLRAERHEATRLAPVGERAHDAPVLGQELRHGALHEDFEPLVHAVVLKGADHLEAGPISHVRETG